MSKCELIAHKDFQVDDALLQSFQRVEFEDVSLLGALLFPGAALDTAWHDRVRTSPEPLTDWAPLVLRTP